MARWSLARILDGQRGSLFPWVPVCFGTGIGLYFLLPAEPAIWVWPGLGFGLVTLALVGRRWAAAPLAVAPWLVLAGLALTGIRAQWVAEPVLWGRYYGPVQGRIVAIDRSGSDKPRLLLDRVVLADTPPERTPRRVRVSLHGPQGAAAPVPGAVVQMTAHLSPPQGPVEPGGFDFQRMAWFLRLGAVGYSRAPMVLWQAPGPDLPLARARMTLSRAVQAALPGEVGAFAAAITTGDRSGIGAETVAALRAANLSHLLAISGLHMGLLTGVVFFALRLGLAAVPHAALQWPCKKIAAVGALLAAAVYLALSGGNVATQRAFVMAAMVLTAILLDRRALTLRAVALAAMVVLVATPETLTGPGFQMSFAATTALVAVFGALRGRAVRPRWLRPVVAVVLSSAVAGLATAPIAAAHFNRVAHYGLVANLASVPLMGSVVMPAAVLAACLAPFGLGWVGLAVMAPAIAWILGVASFVAARPEALSHVVSPGPLVLPLLAAGLLTLALWQGRGRLAGLVPVACAFVLWAGTERPALLVSDTGGLVGAMTEAGRALSKPRGEGFQAAVWLENDGDGASQEEAFGRRPPGAGAAFRVGPMRIAHATGRGAGGRAARLCREADLVILSGARDGAAGCPVFDPPALRRSGALALRLTDDGVTIRTARDSAGRRPWNTPEIRAAIVDAPWWRVFQ